jgi:hypothetical protein
VAGKFTGEGPCLTFLSVVGRWSEGRVCEAAGLQEVCVTKGTWALDNYPEPVDRDDVDA